VEDRVVCVDLEKGSEAAFKEVMDHAKMFFDPIHLRKAMLLIMTGEDKKTCVALYNKALHAPTRAA
jgi:hypothetical protein